MIEVSAGIVFGPDGTILVCRRGEGRSQAHLWEFPGGKREAGETAADCLARELQEELSLPVSSIKTAATVERDAIRFTFLTARTDAQPSLTEHEAYRFVRPRDMLPLAFCPADTGIARALALNDPPLTACFWDFDGTLFDTYPIMTRRLCRACQSVGISADEREVYLLMKETLAHAIQTLADRNSLSPTALADAYRDAAGSSDDPSSFPAMSGIPEAVRRLAAAGCRHYLVTHRDRGALEALASAGLLPYFEDAVTAEDHFRKPAPDSICSLLDRHGIDPMQAVMIGDRPLDVEAGKKAGTLTCLLDPENLFPDTPSDLCAQDAACLPGLLRPAPIL